jgi:hypothetical protein
MDHEKRNTAAGDTLFKARQHEYSLVMQQHPYYCLDTRLGIVAAIVAIGGLLWWVFLLASRKLAGSFQGTDKRDKIDKIDKLRLILIRSIAH